MLALKRLGLGLAEIAVLISGRLSKLDEVLELQQEVLARRRDEALRGLDLVRAARARIARGQTLPLDDLTTLTRETTMNDQAPEWVTKMQPIIDQHLSAADKAKIEALRTSDCDQANYGAQWEGVIAEAKSLLGSDPGAPEARDVARRWRELAYQSTGGDPALFAKMAQVWRESLASPDVAPTLPFSADVWAFVGKAMAHLPPLA